MRFGLACSIERSPLAQAAQFDFIEVSTAQLLKSDSISAAAIPSLVANDLLPPEMLISGPGVVLAPIREHVHRVCERARQFGVKTLAFDADLARSVPPDFDRKQARRQILEFLRMTLPFCASHGITLVCQPLDRARSNIINTLPETMQYVWEVDHPNFQALLDAGLFISSAEPLENLRDALPWIRHVQVPHNGVDLRQIFAELKRARYDDLITVVPATAQEPDPQLLEILKQQWSAA